MKCTFLTADELLRLRGVALAMQESRRTGTPMNAVFPLFDVIAASGDKGELSADLIVSTYSKVTLVNPVAHRRGPVLTWDASSSTQETLKLLNNTTIAEWEYPFYAEFDLLVVSCEQPSEADTIKSDLSVGVWDDDDNRLAQSVSMSLRMNKPNRRLSWVVILASAVQVDASSLSDVSDGVFMNDRWRLPPNPVPTSPLREMGASAAIANLAAEDDYKARSFLTTVTTAKHSVLSFALMKEAHAMALSHTPSVSQNDDVADLSAAAFEAAHDLAETNSTNTGDVRSALTEHGRHRTSVKTSLRRRRETRHG